MSGFRAYFDSTQNTSIKKKSGEIIELSPDESRHLCGSLRAAKNDKVDVFDLSDTILNCEIAEASQKRALVRILQTRQIPTPNAEVYIAQCLPKGKVFDDIVRQSVELGASGIFPLVSERTQIRFENDADAKRKVQKWKVHVVEAIKQSANFAKYRMDNPQSLKNFLENECGQFDIKIVASLRGNPKPIFKLLEDAKATLSTPRICVLIGPEGDLSSAEYDAAELVGFQSATLGENVMKCDTAALCATACVKCYFSAK